MKLLIADDEKLTREGLISSIDWTSLGITEIYQADDGIHGLELAKETHPDIVLSDIRMPRLDGIDMAAELKKLFPEINIIFMSGYSDKEYLKAAIKLKAISYVEKPIDPSEIREAVLEALKNKKTQDANSDAKKEHHDYASSSLARSLIHPNFGTKEEILHSFHKLSFSIHESTVFYTLLFSFKKPLAESPTHLLSGFFTDFHTLLTDHGFSEIHGIKQEHYLIYHIFSDIVSKHTLELLSSKAAFLLEALENDFFLSIGKGVQEVTKIYESYQAAVLQLQTGFYHPYGSIFFPESVSLNLGNFSSVPLSVEDFKAYLSQKDPQINDRIEAMYDTLQKSKNVLPNHIKDFYYQLISAVHEAYHLLQLPIPEERYEEVNIFETVFHCGTLAEIHALLQHELSVFFQQAELFKEESTQITAIKSFIASHYQDDTLSIKDLSDHVFLSTSYICTLFKSETGQTLNQYITLYRIEKAKRLLADPRYKVADISSKVGYSDGNYFGKTFKKIVGLSPTEYQEQVTGL